ncbi:hypothetical protein J6590_002457 [Homalodisca vitripennis]|nr:hypothetical protein J6590_002457 [Homalodisca vitripennis]
MTITVTVAGRLSGPGNYGTGAERVLIVQYTSVFDCSQLLVDCPAGNYRTGAERCCNVCKACYSVLDCGTQDLLKSQLLVDCPAQGTMGLGLGECCNVVQNTCLFVLDCRDSGSTQVTLLVDCPAQGTIGLELRECCNVVQSTCLFVPVGTQDLLSVDTVWVPVSRSGPQRARDGRWTVSPVLFSTSTSNPYHVFCLLIVSILSGFPLVGPVPRELEMDAGQFHLFCSPLSILSGFPLVGPVPRELEMDAGQFHLFCSPRPRAVYTKFLFTNSVDTVRVPVSRSGPQRARDGRWTVSPVLISTSTSNPYRFVTNSVDTVWVPVSRSGPQRARDGRWTVSPVLFSTSTSRFPLVGPVPRELEMDAGQFHMFCSPRPRAVHTTLLFTNSVDTVKVPVSRSGFPLVGPVPRELEMDAGWTVSPDLFSTSTSDRQWTARRTDGFTAQEGVEPRMSRKSTIARRESHIK